MYVMDADENPPFLRNCKSNRHLGFGESQPERRVDSHDFPRGPHLRPQDDLGIGESVERENGLFDRNVGGTKSFRKTKVLQRSPQHDLGRQLGQGDADRLADKGHRTRGPGVDLQQVKSAVFHGILDIHQADHLQFPGNQFRLTLDQFEKLFGEAHSGENAGTVARMYPRFFDMLHDAGDYCFSAVADGIHIHFDGVFQKLIDENRMIGRDLQGLLHELAQAVSVVDYFHGAATQNIGRPHQHRIADMFRRIQGPGHIRRRRVFRLFQFKLVDDFLKTFPVFRPVDGIGRCTENLSPCGFQTLGQIQRRLTAELDDDAHGLFAGEDVKNIFQGNWFEKKLVGGVVIGAHRLRIGVHHEAFVAFLPKGEGGMDTAVIELDALPDSVGTAADDQHPGFFRRPRLAFFLICRIVIGGVGFKLGGAGVDQLIDRQQVFGKTAAAELAFRNFPEFSQPPVRKTPALCFPERLFR
ncbi:MAG: hypothetical protein A4E66_02582 [Syntrophus sp. PtaB.Bin001]|nr:MAG: hypothetical protein A4E66_02582 [Syntrophus sp. PtaB.Bin001]